jgi:hypothetical protein
VGSTRRCSTSTASRTCLSRAGRRSSTQRRTARSSGLSQAPSHRPSHRRKALSDRATSFRARTLGSRSVPGRRADPPRLTPNPRSRASSGDDSECSFIRQVVLRAIARSVSRLRGGQSGLLPSGAPTVACWSLPACFLWRSLRPWRLGAQRLLKSSSPEVASSGARSHLKPAHTQPTGCGKHEPRSLDALR